MAVLIGTLLLDGGARALPPAFDGLPAPYDGHGLVGAERGEVDDAGQLAVRLELAYAREPLRIDVPANGPVVSDALTARVALHAGLFRRRLEIGLVAPVSLLVYTSAGIAALANAGETAPSVAAG